MIYGELLDRINMAYTHHRISTPEWVTFRLYLIEAFSAGGQRMIMFSQFLDEMKI